MQWPVQRRKFQMQIFKAQRKFRFMDGLVEIQSLWPAQRIKTIKFRCEAQRKFRFSCRVKGNSDLVARAAEKILNPDLKPRANSDVVAGLEEIHIQWPAQRRNLVCSDFRLRGNSDSRAGQRKLIFSGLCSGENFKFRFEAQRKFRFSGSRSGEHV